MKVSPGREMFLKIEVKPSADLSRLEEVLVVTEKQEQNAVAESGVRVRAADILAQRLPSVPEKPVTDAGIEAAGGSGSAKPVSSAQETSTGTQPLTPAESSVKPEAAPHVARTASTKITGSGATATKPAKATVVSSDSSQSAPVSGQTVNGQSPKKTTPKPPSGDPALNNGSHAASNGAAVRPPKSANEPPKPAVTPKSQPATEDDPH